MWNKNNNKNKKKKKKKKRKAQPEFSEISSLTRPWLRTPHTPHHRTQLTRCVTAYEAAETKHVERELATAERARRLAKSMREVGERKVLERKAPAALVPPISRVGRQRPALERCG